MTVATGRADHLVSLVTYLHASELVFTQFSEFGDVEFARVCTALANHAGELRRFYRELAAALGYLPDPDTLSELVAAKAESIGEMLDESGAKERSA